MSTMSKDIKNFIETQLKTPMVLESFLSHFQWKGLSWDIKEWGKLFSDDTSQELTLRFGKIENQEMQKPQWESNCLSSKMTYDNFLKWENDTKITQNSMCNTLMTSDKYWAYFDYFYMKNLKNKELANELVSWKDFGFTKLDSENSTIWIGTKGANTPCHIDTYGCNIVCQMYGTKRWILFPKEQSEHLYPSRIPYEESSIYSKVGFPCPDMKLFPKTYFTTPFIVTLKPGQCLLVPKHWWHFVENLELSISINAWIECLDDPNDKLKEVVTMYQIGSICQSITNPCLINDIFNPNTLNVATLGSSELLDLLIEAINSYSLIETNKVNTINDLSEAEGCISILKNPNIVTIESVPFQYYLNLFGNKHSEGEFPKKHADSNATLLTVIETLTDDRVIEKIVEVLKEKLKNNMNSSFKPVHC